MLSMHNELKRNVLGHIRQNNQKNEYFQFKLESTHQHIQE